MDNKRKEIICPVCGIVMRFTKRITPPANGIGGLIYRCPTRDNEGGCGYTTEVLVHFANEEQEIII